MTLEYLSDSGMESLCANKIWSFRTVLMSDYVPFFFPTWEAVVGVAQTHFGGPDLEKNSVRCNYWHIVLSIGKHLRIR